MPAQSSKIISDTYCNEAWRNVHFDDSGWLAPCCTFREHRPKNINSVSEYWDSDWLADARQKMLNGERVAGCQNCYAKEGRGERSQRMAKNKQHGYITTPKLKSMEISFGNICNKNCNICRPTRSSMIAKDYQKLEKTDPDFKFAMGMRQREVNATKRYVSRLPDYKQSLESVNHIQLDGGEPFYTRQCTELLEYMIENKMFDRSISAVTNGSVNDEQVAMLKQFQHVFFGLSIDGIEDMYHVTRSPHDWNWWIEHHNRIIEAGFARKYNSVIHCLNIHQLPEQLEYFTSHRDGSDHPCFDFTALVSHDHLLPDVVPINILEDTIERLQQREHLCENNAELDNLRNCVIHLEWYTKNRKEIHQVNFKRMVDVFGPAKKIDYQKHLPWKIQT